MGQDFYSIACWFIALFFSFLAYCVTYTFILSAQEGKICVLQLPTFKVQHM